MTSVLSTLTGTKQINVWIKALGVCAAALLLKLYRAFKSRKLPPGSTGLPVLGATLEYVSDPKKFILSRAAKYGGTFKSNVLMMDMVFLAPTEANCKLIYSKSDLGWPEHWKDVVGRTSLPMINNPLHKRVRTLNSRAFTEKQLELYLPTFQKLTKNFLQHWAELGKASGGQHQELYLEIKEYAFTLAQEVLLGLTLPKETTAGFVKLFDKTTSGLEVVAPFNVPGMAWRTVMNSRKKLMVEYQKIIDNRKSELKAGAKPTSMLDSMLTSGTEIPDEELQDFCVAMMFAGHDTTLSTLQTALHWLKEVPGIEAELREEVRRAWDGSAPITREVFAKVPKVFAFIQETWRITPPIHLTLRKLTESVQADGYDIPAGWTVAMAATWANSNTDNAEEFRISRHINADGVYQDRAFQPSNFAVFGGGNRMCIGYKFSRDEIGIFMLQLLHGYTYQGSSTEVKFPFNGFRVKGTFQALAK